MPFLAGVYWHQATVDGSNAFDPTLYLLPEQRSLSVVVPEPGAAALLVVGLAGLAVLPGIRRRRV